MAIKKAKNKFLFQFVHEYILCFHSKNKYRYVCVVSGLGYLSYKKWGERLLILLCYTNK